MDFAGLAFVGCALLLFLLFLVLIPAAGKAATWIRRFLGFGADQPVRKQAVQAPTTTVTGSASPYGMDYGSFAGNYDSSGGDSSGSSSSSSSINAAGSSDFSCSTYGSDSSYLGSDCTGQSGGGGSFDNN